MSKDHNTVAAAELRANRIPWPPILLVAVIGAAWALKHYLPLAWPGLDDWPARLAGGVFVVAGAVFIASAVVALRNADTTIMPHGRAGVLVTSGPYARFRNPIYLGEAFVLLGLSILVTNLWLAIGAAVFAIAITGLQIVPEERHLEARFGDTYRAYMANTRRWI